MSLLCLLYKYIVYYELAIVVQLINRNFDFLFQTMKLLAMFLLLICIFCDGYAAESKSEKRMSQGSLLHLYKTIFSPSVQDKRVWSKHPWTLDALQDEVLDPEKISFNKK